MTRLPPIDLDPIMLAARVAKALSKSHRLAFAQLAPDFTVVQHSPNFVALLAQPDWQLAGKRIDALLDEFVGADAVLHNVLAGQLPVYQLEFVNRVQPDGSVVYLNFQVSALDEHQPERGLLLLVEDVTDYGRLQQTLTQDRNELLLLQQKLARTNDELNRSNKLKSLFLSMAAHDLRSPLSIIMGYTDLLQRHLTDDDAAKAGRYLLNISTQAQRMDRLVNDLLDLDLIERGELKVKPREHDFVQLVREITEAEKLNFNDRLIDIKLPHQPIHVLLDGEKISRVIHNLVNNACKYTPDNEKIAILVAHIDGEAIFQIMDNGKGMSADQLENLYEPYYRTEDVKESRIEGRGLGLFIVKMLVEAHHGRVEVESAVGRGSTFTVYLPLHIELNELEDV